MNTIRQHWLVGLAVCQLTGLALAQDTVQWGKTVLPEARTVAEGMKAYYEPGRVEQKGAVNSLTLYRDASPDSSAELGRYQINCETREFVRTANGQTSQPAKILAGEELYPLGRKLCGWDSPSVLKKIWEGAGG